MSNRAAKGTNLQTTWVKPHCDIKDVLSMIKDRPLFIFLTTASK